MIYEIMKWSVDEHVHYRYYDDHSIFLCHHRSTMEAVMLRHVHQVLPIFEAIDGWLLYAVVVDLLPLTLRQLCPASEIEFDRCEFVNFLEAERARGGNK